MNKVELGSFTDSTAMVLDVEKLIGSHLCIQANSGGGKSGAIRRLLEVTHGQLQHIVLDVEDEFYTLREQHEYMIAGGDNGDCAATVRNAGALATMILETGYSAIIQLNDLHVEDRREFIAAFLDALIAAPKALWHPALVVLDEAQMYAPQVGSVASSNAVIALMTLGRKRGFTGILAAPRLANISKDATGPVNNWLMGRIGQPADRKSSADALGFGSNSSEARGLIELDTGQFWAFGPALCRAPTLAQIGRASTTYIRAGMAAVPTPPAPAAMKQMLAKLNAAAAPVTVDAGTTDFSALHAEISRLKSLLKDSASATSAADIAAARQQGYEAGVTDGVIRGENRAKAALSAVQDRLNDALTIANGAIDSLDGPALAAVPRPQVTAPPVKPADKAGTSSPAPRSAIPANTGGLTPALRRAINAIGWWRQIGIDPVEKSRACVVAGLSPKASTFGVYVADLTKRGLLTTPAPGKVSLTAEGWGEADVPTGGTADDLHDMAAKLLSPQEVKVFDIIHGAYPKSISRAAVAARMGLSPTASTTGVYIASVASYGIIETSGRGEVRAADWLFP